MKPKTKMVLGGAAAVGVAGALGYWLKVRPWHLHWGTTPEETRRPLPGDELVPDPELASTHAITINAPAEEVWPWLVQMGQGRGGFYSYAWLENLVGCRMKNAKDIHPEWQHLAVGDRVYLHPKAPALTVRIVEPGKALVFGETWGFYVEPIDRHRSRLLVRGRGRMAGGNALLRFFLWRLVYEPAHFVMERKMLLGIKQRVERKHGKVPRKLRAA